MAGGLPAQPYFLGPRTVDFAKTAAKSCAPRIYECGHLLAAEPLNASVNLELVFTKASLIRIAHVFGNDIVHEWILVESVV